MHILIDILAVLIMLVAVFQAAALGWLLHIETVFDDLHMVKSKRYGFQDKKSVSKQSTRMLVYTCVSCVVAASVILLA